MLSSSSSDIGFEAGVHVVFDASAKERHNFKDVRHNTYLVNKIEKGFNHRERCVCVASIGSILKSWRVFLLAIWRKTNIQVIVIKINAL